ncbi:peptidoglycan editing factor PgeF [Geminocystis sp. CENA526]|uniref:peptidoglycan editing factor PgeF n=1 Tax=Geminocystis sp. CENA526 TaxID=1355871 RepID=UPI003D6F108F
MSNPTSSAWQWQETDNGNYLTCQLLKDWQHGFFSSHFQGKPPEILVNHLNPKASTYRLKQIHSDIVHYTDKVDVLKQETDLVQGDGIITEKPLQSVWAASADCTPVLIADRGTGKVTAIHSGWRGTASNIVPKAIQLLKSQGSKEENLLFALGPAIDGKVYQVDKLVAIKVLKTIITGDLEDDLILEKAYQFTNKPILPDTEKDKVKLNVTQVINLQIQGQNIPIDNISIAPYCTYQTPEYFFSYRRTKEKNVQWSGIVSS